VGISHKVKLPNRELGKTQTFGLRCIQLWSRCAPCRDTEFSFLYVCLC